MKDPNLGNCAPFQTTLAAITIPIQSNLYPLPFNFHFLDCPIGENYYFVIKDLRENFTILNYAFPSELFPNNKKFLIK
jgi:hypothetical protein